jgi:hypothetical protein
MKKNFSLTLVLISVLLILSCSKKDDDTASGPFEQQLRDLNSMLVETNTYKISAFRDEANDLYDLLGDWSKDDTFKWDIKHNVGHLYSNEIQNPYDSFTRKDLHFETYADTLGVYIDRWVDPDYSTVFLQLVNLERNVSFTVRYEFYGVEYFITYSKL